MVNFEQIRTVIAEGLNDFLGMPVIESDTPHNIPAQPFLTYNFITTGIKPESYPGMTATYDGTNIIETYSEQPTMVASFNSYAYRKADSVQNAMKVQDWFRVIGHDILKSSNIVVVDVDDIHNRDVQIGDEWELRNGFDVTFRALNTFDMTQTTIDKANIRRA